MRNYLHSILSRQDRIAKMVLWSSSSAPIRIRESIATLPALVWGKQEDYLISAPPWHYGFGLHSPMDRFLRLDGKILLLGSDHDAVTFLHYVEHVTEIPDKRIRRFQVPIEEEGRRVWRAMEEFDTSGEGAHAHWPDRFFAEIVEAYLTAAANHGGQVGNALSYLLRARGLLMRAVAKNPTAADRLRGSATNKFLSDEKHGEMS